MSARIDQTKIIESLKDFVQEFQPLEGADKLFTLTDYRTNASYCECHVKADRLVALSTIDVPLDPDEQGEYRANREMVLDHSAFQAMKEDAKNRRTFSNIVTEYNKDFDAGHPLKIIGGQHRFEAIRQALDAGVNEYHGLKVYLALNTDQRLDVQLISNTNIAISQDLFDRMQETSRGPELREWCQQVGFLKEKQDFADRKQRGGAITVQVARTFITNYYRGKAVDVAKFEVTDTTPTICPSGEHDPDWETLKKNTRNVWTDKKLQEAAKRFAELVKAQRAWFADKKPKPKPKPDYPEKAANAAVQSAWAFVAGMLHNNETRLKRHFALASKNGKDPLNAAALAKGRHKSDAENYRGLGYRTDPRERGRFVELFSLQAEDGKGITPNTIDVAIKKFHAKQAQLEVIKAKEK